MAIDKDQHFLEMAERYANGSTEEAEDISSAAVTSIAFSLLVIARAVDAGEIGIHIVGPGHVH